MAGSHDLVYNVFDGKFSMDLQLPGVKSFINFCHFLVVTDLTGREGCGEKGKEGRWRVGGRKEGGTERRGRGRGREGEREKRKKKLTVVESALNNSLCSSSWDASTPFPHALHLPFVVPGKPHPLISYLSAQRLYCKISQ